jgi:hypothetical protein
LFGNIFAIPTLTDAAVTANPAHLVLITCGIGSFKISVFTIAKFKVQDKFHKSLFTFTSFNFTDNSNSQLLFISSHTYLKVFPFFCAFLNNVSKYLSSFFISSKN